MRTSRYTDTAAYQQANSEPPRSRPIMAYFGRAVNRPKLAYLANFQCAPGPAESLATRERPCKSARFPRTRRRTALHRFGLNPARSKMALVISRLLMGRPEARRTAII